MIYQIGLLTCAIGTIWFVMTVFEGVETCSEFFWRVLAVSVLFIIPGLLLYFDLWIVVAIYYGGLCLYARHAI